MKNRKNKKIVLFFSFTIIIVLFLIMPKAIELMKINKERVELTSKLNKMILEEENLKKEISRLSDIEYQTKYIREKYSMIKPGEYKIKSE